jgi:dipeptidyl aminopeptidase/acylaminoacyl peptidase
MSKLIPLRDFFRNPDKTAYSISPDGNSIAFLAPYENRMNIHIQPRGKADVKRITAITDRDLAGYFWKGNDKILYVRDFGGDENYHLFLTTTDGKTNKDLTPFENVCVYIVDELPDDDQHLIIQMNQRNPEVFDVYRLNVESGEMTIITENPGEVTGWLTDHDGKLRAAYTSDGVNSSLLYRDSESEKFQTITTTSFKDSLNPLFFTFDNQALFCASNLGRDKMAIVRYDPKANREVGEIFAHPEVDVSQMSYSHKRKCLTAISYITWKQHQHFLDSETQAVFRKLEAHLPDIEITVQAMNQAEDIWIVRTHSDRSRGAYYLYETKLDAIDKLADVCAWLHEEDLCEMKPIQYQSRDGLTIHGYLTLPKNNESKALPVIINPHGGPWARDYWGFNPLVQFFANRGYAVLQMNFRGSTEYGKAFWQASFKQWGKAMQDDITDGVRWLIDQGIADPKRMAIYGASYGGYAVLAGLAFTPELYACGIDYVGVSNLFTFLETVPPYWKPQLEMMYEMVGHPERDKAILTASSPVFHVDKIRVPLFVIQGAKDPRVNINESNQIVDALKARGIEVPYLVKENEGHGFHNEENKFEAFEAMESFLDKHLK